MHSNCKIPPICRHTKIYNFLHKVPVHVTLESYLKNTFIIIYEANFF